MSRKSFYLLLISIFLTALIPCEVFSAEKKASDKGRELEKLKNTKAVIETKLGNIEIKFFRCRCPWNFYFTIFDNTKKNDN